MSGPEDDRLASLERRVAELEERLGVAAASEPAAVAPLLALGTTPPAPPAPPAPRPTATASPAAAAALSAATASPAAANASPPKASPPWAQVIAELEEQLTGRALAVVGGVALVVGAVFFLSLAFSRGWIGPEGRVLIGIAASGLTLALGGWMLDHRQPIVGQVLVAVGLAVVSLSMFAATRLYQLVPVELALIGTLVAAVAAAYLAVRNNAEIIAVLSLVAVLGAPPVLGASPSLVTIAYIGSVLVGFAVLALLRTWRWLPSIAFVLSAPQLASWLAGDASPAIGFAAAVVFWLLNVIAAGGEEYLRPRNNLRAGSAMLLLANAAFLIWAGFTMLVGPNEALRGPFLVAVALGHMIVGGVFLLREGDRHPFGMLAAGTGLAALAMAAPVQFGGPPVPIAWAAEAVAVAWLASRRAHPQAALGAAVLGSLALLHLVVSEYPLAGASPVATAGDWPFINASGLTLAFLTASAALAAWFMRSRAIVAAIAAIAVLAVANAAPHELGASALIACWVALALAAIALDAFIIGRLSPNGPISLRLPVELNLATLLAAAVVAAVTIAHAMSLELPIEAFGRVRPPVVPFSDGRALTLAILVAGTAVAGWIHQRRFSLELPAVASLVGAGLILAYGSVYEVHGDAAIVIAAGLAALGFLLADAPGVDEWSWTLANVASFALVGCATFAAIVVIAPPDRLTVADTALINHLPFVSGATATFGAIAGALAVAVNRNREERFAPWAGLVAGVLVVYLLSIGVVDLFQARIPGPILFEEIATQAQVALSVLWVVLGTIVFVFGVAGRHLVVRQSGLALLALASAKVFIFDLASLDVAYRVLSLVALGTFLLVTAWVYARLRRRPDDAQPDDVPPDDVPPAPEPGSATQEAGA
jgi:uncharacterized membrane protein